MRVERPGAGSRISVRGHRRRPRWHLGGAADSRSFSHCRKAALLFQQGQDAEQSLPDRRGEEFLFCTLKISSEHRAAQKHTAAKEIFLVSCFLLVLRDVSLALKIFTLICSVFVLWPFHDILDLKILSVI